MVDTLTVFWDVASCVNLYYIIRLNLGDLYFNDTVRLFLTENQARIITVFSNSEWRLQWHGRGPHRPQGGGTCVGGCSKHTNTKICGGLFRVRFCCPDRRQYFAFLIWNLGVSSLTNTGGRRLVIFKQLKYGFVFYIHGSVHRDSVLIRSNKMQQYAGIYLLQVYSTYWMDARNM